MVAIKSLALFATAMLVPMVLPILFIFLFDEGGPLQFASYAKVAMNVMPLLWIGACFIAIYLAVRLGKTTA